MSVTLKITFNDDLRRVTLPATTTFDDLKKRLSQMFSDYVLSNRLSYIDDEDDRVTIQTTEELQEAFRLSRGGVLRLFVEENEDEDADYEEIDSDDESDDRVHSAICDNCDERIVGIRYKCGNCADYDLCQSCEKHDGVHDSTHLFIKIRAPLSPWASPVRVLLPNLYPQQQVPCWARRVQQYMAQREQCERQRAAQREQYEQHAQRVQQARQQWFEQLQAQRAAQASNGCPRFAGQCGRPASSEQPQCGRPASAEHPFANFFQHLIQQIEALNEREEESNTNTNNTNNNNTNTDENTEQPNPFRVVIHFRNNEEQKEEQKEEKTEQQPQAQPDVTSSEALVEDVVEDAPKQQSYQPEENQPILTDAQPEPSAPVVEEPKQEVVVEQAKPEEPKRELTRFEQLLNTLEDMGFTDRRKNIEVLVRTAGNLEAAVQSLISF